MIKINDLTKRYGDSVILEHTSYTFPQRGIVCLMGASGGGKTTLLNLLAGFDTDYEGDISVGNASISNMDADTLCQYRKDNIGFVFQNYYLLSGYTVLENILLARELAEESHQQSVKDARLLLEQLGILEKENQRTENLSGGQKQRVAIARALISNPQIIFADEPTGALDRTASNEIMSLLKEISRERLVVVITHDQKICDFADEVIHIQEKKIVPEKMAGNNIAVEKPLVTSKASKTSSATHAVKNLRVHIRRYIAVSLAISIGMLAFLFSLSFGNVLEGSIQGFKTKNTAFNNGYIKGTDDGNVFAFLKSDERIENIYYQYKLDDISLFYGGKTEIMTEKFPTPKAIEKLSYGVMPRNGMNEIAITPSLAKKFSPEINNLLGKEITIEYDGKSYALTISGIYNAGYDDFFVSSDIEQQWYAKIQDQDNYSISYDVAEFSDIVAVSNALKMKAIDSKNSSKEVGAMQDTFDRLGKLFLVISILILGIGLFICTVLLLKQQNARYREIGLLSALGFGKSRIAAMIMEENLLLSALATATNLLLLLFSLLISNAVNFPFIVSGMQILLCVISTFVVVLLVRGTITLKLIRTEPAEALRK